MKTSRFTEEQIVQILRMASQRTNNWQRVPHV